MKLTYKKASLEDLELLTETRITVLRAANKLDDTVDMNIVKEQSRDYYRHFLADESHIAYLVYDGETFAGSGGISFFRVMPTFHNPDGRKAYIMNMYTAPEYRRKGIGRQTLGLLVAAAREKGITAISLEATDMGRPLYEKFGFIGMEHEMELPEDVQDP
ncbi:GNAT family N-acetyltransferase [[Clostridium] symbiosum]|uniref:GNAT family N-acetyltransferase n=1 Tax=Clostridium symbiosum TaxID=1512 RepID=UPI001D071764|nr:GNAT family N-acetyltransferase [[Clostridium] symbiosum]MCB6609103.1 GNAT family N-acetyltransferase [[Clostridium] symbiosum]MCB6933423.1 GNAT family N-acetyltransferase [[Clostridium] symbiosum]